MRVKLMCNNDQRTAQSLDEKGNIVWSQIVGFSGTNLQGQPLEGQAEGVGNVSFNMNLSGTQVAAVKYGQTIEIDLPVGEASPSAPSVATRPTPSA